MDSYKLRVTLNNNIDDIVEYIDKVSEMYIIVREGNTRIKDHIHLWIYGNPTRYKLSKVCGKGNQSYSLSKCKEKYPYQYWKYMEKQNVPEWVNVPPEQVELFEEYKKVEKQEIKIKNDLKVWQIIYKEVVDGYADAISSTNRFKKFDLDEYIMIKVIDYHKINCKVINKHRVFSYIDTVKFNLPSMIENCMVDNSMMYRDWLEQYKPRRMF